MFTAEFARNYRQGRVIGIDTDPLAIAKAKQKHTGLPHLAFMQLSVYDLLANRERLGGVYAIYSKQTIHHLGNLPKALDQMHDLLLPGGTIFLHDFDRSLATQESHRCGLTATQQCRLYKALTQGEIEREIKRLAPIEQLHALIFLSILASYDSKEIIKLLTGKGMGCQIMYHPENLSFALCAVKPS